MNSNEYKNSDEYSKEECIKIIDYFMDLRMDFINEFLKKNNISKTSKDTKADIREKLEKALADKKIEHKDIVNYLLIVEPLRKQHIILYDGPENDVEDWRKEKFFNDLIQEKNLSKFYNSSLDIIPPKSMSLSSIKYKPGKELEIYALERIDYWKRKSEYDEIKLINSEQIELKAVVNRLDRCIICFKWNLVSNKATLHISQLPSGYNYETTINSFKKLMKSFLDLNKFSKLDLRSVIKKLHKLEESGNAETRSHTLNYQDVSGITYGAKSSSNEDSVVRNDELGKAFEIIREKGSGHIGNFFWLPSSVFKIAENKLKEEIHTIILGEEGRINFLTPNKKEDIEYVLSRVRRISK